MELHIFTPANSKMTVEIEVPSAMQQKEPIMETPKKLKRSYTREFLLSLSDLEICKKLPNGFDKSLLSELEDASHGGYDRLRSVGSSSLQGFRRTDYSRGPNRWDSRSNGRSDTDSNLERSLEPGRRYGSLARRPGQHPEHDGLLGRPTGYAAGPSSPRFRSNNHLPHNRSSEVYQPPRPFKCGPWTGIRTAVPHSRREGKDSYNDETFGTTDSTSEDRVEEEKKRRAEFELMRKEHQKALQEKQKFNSSKIEDSLSDVTEPRVNPVDGKVPNDSDQVLKQAQQDESGRSVSHQIHTGRPLVPPGFVNTSVEKSSTVKTLIHSEPLELGNELENSHQDIKTTAQERDSRRLERVTIPSASESGNGMSIPSVLNGSDQVKKSGLIDVSEVLDNGEILWLDDPEVTGVTVHGEPGRSTSILEKLFGSALTSGVDGTSNLLEDQDSKAEDNLSPNTLQSKFAGWFLEEEKKTLSDTSQEKPHNLLALISGSDKDGYGEADVMTMGSILPPTEMVGPQMASKPYSTSNTPEQKPAVLTCEDLEQSILSEVGKTTSHTQHSEPENLGGDEKAASPDASVDSLASQHLLSLLQKGMGSKNLESTSAVKEAFPEKPSDLKVEATDFIHKDVGENTEGLKSSRETLTLEALFGAAFMNELHSAQQNSVAFVRTDVKDPQSKPFPSFDGAVFPSTRNEIGGPNDGYGKELKFSNPLADVDLRFRGLDKGIEVRVPKEDSFIARGDHINSSKSSINVGENLSAFGAASEDERSFTRGRMVNPELPYENIHPLASSPYLHASQANHGKPVFDPLIPHDSHLDPHVKFMPPNVPIHHQLPINMGHPPLLPPILQQMRMAGNVPSHLVGAFPGEAPIPPHLGYNKPASYLAERNPMQGFPFGPGVPSPGPEFGAAYNPSEAFQRLLGMELGTNPKQQVHPFAAGGGQSHGRPIYGPELDMGFRYI